MAKVIREDGDTTLSDYPKRFTAPTDPCQPRDDLLAIFGRYVEDLLGEDIAGRAVAELAAHPVVISAAHHGVDYFFSSVHCNLIYFLSGREGERPRTTVPVFAFGNVSLNNLTYPRGLLIYRVMPEVLSRMPLKLPVFPNRFNRCMVSRVSPFDAEMVRTAQVRGSKMAADRQIPPVMGDVVHRLLDDVYLDPAVLGQPSYARQAVMLNHRIGKQLSVDPDAGPDMVWAEMETLASRLLAADLTDPASLAHQVMFVADIRRRVLEGLDGVRGCWRRKALHGQGGGASGTVFFWGVDPRGRRAPLALEERPGRGVFLRGVDDHGIIYRRALIPEDLIEGLMTGDLLPSLFTCFLVVALARGVACIGGYFQCEYLPVMQNAVAEALAAEGMTERAWKVAAAPADYYLSHAGGMMIEIDNRRLAPAGPLEIIASGGLSGKDAAAIGRASIRHAHMAAVFEGAMDILPRGSRPADLNVGLARDCYALLRRRLVVK